MTSVAKPIRSRLSVSNLWKWAILLGVLVALYQVRTLQLDVRAYYWIKHQWPAEHVGERAMQLDRYHAVVQAMPVTAVKNNLSGLTYDATRKQLWAVLNNPEELLAMDRDGRVIGRYGLQGFQDVEGIAWLGEDLLVLAEEQRHSLVVIPVPKSESVIRRDQGRALTLTIGSGENKGFEGLSYDRVNDRLFVVKEDEPMALYEVRGLKRSLLGDFNLEVIDHEDWIQRVFASDLSSVHYDEGTGHLALLSHESKLIVELDGKGEVAGFRSLSSGFAGLDEGVPQGEGMTFDEQGNLYLVSEPSLFYRFRRGE